MMTPTRACARPCCARCSPSPSACGARVLLAAPDDIAERDLTLSRAEHPSLDPILAIQSFYVMAAGLAEARGMDPDQPRHLSKVTRTH